MSVPTHTRVLVRGGGEMGSGVAWRLLRCGYRVIIAETARPTAIRRWVCFSEAVYDGRKGIEGVSAVLCPDLKSVENAMANGDIPLIVSDEPVQLRDCAPDVIVDAILAKTGGTTPRGLAQHTIGLGPGFVAAGDVDCVIETNRGANLGRCIWSGSAESNTGVPGMLGGETARRVLRAPTAGEVIPLAQIGQSVRVDETVARVGSVDIRAQIGGIVRGMLRPGHTVTSGTKIGDIDPRGDLETCRRISDKALAIAGGVLEALLSYPPKH